MLDRGEKIRVARRLRAAINLDQGYIDIKECLSIADELEHAGTYRRGVTRSAREAKNLTTSFNVNPAIENITGSELRQILDLKTLGDGLLIEFFLKNPGRAASIEDISSILSTSDHSARNAIYELRFNFKRLGFGRIISNKRGEGYYIAESRGREIYKYVESWKKSFRLQA